MRRCPDVTRATPISQIGSGCSNGFSLGKDMSIASGKSLRSLVHKWLGPTSGTPVKISRFNRRQSNQRTYVHIELLLQSGPVGLFFFRHDDGSWCVFPPNSERPVLRVH